MVKKILRKVFYNLWFDGYQDEAIKRFHEIKKVDFPRLNRSEAVRLMMDTAIRTLKLVALLTFLLAATTGYGQSPIDFTNKDNQVTGLATFVFAATTYQILRKRLDVPKLPAYLISHISAAALSLAHDHYKDGSPGRISRQKQYSMLVGITFSTVITLNLFE